VELINYKTRLQPLNRAVYFGLLLLIGTISGCAPPPPEPGIGNVIAWDELPGWTEDSHAEAWPALLQQCGRMASRQSQWEKICREAESITGIDNQQARQFFEKHFVAHIVNPSPREDGSPGTGLVTGYYEPLLRGSLVPGGPYQHALYGKPDDLLRIDLASVYPELSKMKLRGRMEGNRIVPYYDRADIDNGESPLRGNELVWVDDPVDAFFLHVQGSGKIRLDDGSMMAVGYADQNGQPYTSIGRILIEQGEIAREDISLFTIRRWLRDNPQQAMDLLEQNRSYIFFSVREVADENPRGSLNVPLTPYRSIAVDPSTIPLGNPVWLDTSYPGDGSAMQRLTFAQDTGGAIKGYARADLFCGNGDDAELLAGEMKQEARLYVLLPNSSAM
jgi:membrane-bound lytic murein transglycosylase A